MSVDSLELMDFEKARADILLSEHRDMGPLDDLPGPLPEAEHPLQGSQLAVDGGVRRPLRLAKPIGRGGTTRRPSRPRPLPEPDSTTHRETWEVLRGAALHGLSHANDGTKAYTWNARN